METALHVDTVSLDEKTKELVAIDQTKLPGELVLLRLSDKQEIYDAIKRLSIRGAPAIGVAAAIGLYVCACRLSAGNAELFRQEVHDIKTYLASARPTAVNLAWALERMESEMLRQKGDAEALLESLHREACRIRDEDIAVCRRLGENGLKLIRNGSRILTHCNAGQLATVRYGTALAPIYVGREQGMQFSVYCDETRPLLQGARLSAYEMMACGADTTVLCDNMVSSLLENDPVDAVFVGCDRVAACGDVANKIGTSGVAKIAKDSGIPFYVFAPTSTIDMRTPDGKSIVIEQRDPEEVAETWYKTRMTPKGVKIYNPAFDVTKAEYITAIVTEYGIAYPPYDVSLREIFKEKEEHPIAF